MKNGLRRLRMSSRHAGVSGLPAQPASGDSTLINRPPTASFSLFHSSVLGQSGSPGRTRRFAGPVGVLAVSANDEGGRPAERREAVAASLSSVLLSISQRPFGKVPYSVPVGHR